MVAYAHRFFSNSIIQAICFVLIIWVAYEIRDILAILFLSFVVMAGFAPIVGYFQKRNVPRILAVLIPYLGLVIILGIAGIIIVPALITQTEQLIQNIPGYANLLTQKFGSTSIVGSTVRTSLSSIFGSISEFIVNVPSAVTTAVISAFTILIVSLYLLWDKVSPNRSYVWLLPDTLGGETVIEIEKAMGGWLRGQIILSLIIGFLAWVGLLILHVNYAAALGVLTGLLEVIPYVGPILSAVIAILVALGMSLNKAILTAILFFIIQQLEGNIIVPQVMKYSVKVHPVTIILSILIGAHFLGILGAIIAVPVVTALSVLLQHTIPGWKNRPGVVL